MEVSCLADPPPSRGHQGRVLLDWVTFMAVVHRQRPADSVEDLLCRLEPRLRAVLARFRIPYEDGEDLLQQSLLAYLYKHDTVINPEPWLVGTLRNRCLMYWRTRRRRLYQAVDSSLLESLAEPRQPTQETAALCRDLENVIARLPERCRSLLRLRYRLGCEPPEAAERLGYRPSGIYKIMERCLAALTGRLVASGLAEEKTDV